LSSGMSEAAMTRARADRAAAEQRIADLEALRAAELGGECDLASIDLIDVSIAADRRAIIIADQRIAIIARELRQQDAARRQARADTAIATIGRRLAKRNALATELVIAIARVVELAEQVKDETPIKKAWPFPELLPRHFDWRFHDLGRQIMFVLRRAGGDLIPAEVKQAIGWAESGDGIARAPTPRLPSDLPSVLARNGDYILETLRNVQINEPETEADAA